eukprot:jgi/Bigna1/135411/aug1.29_g10119
MMDDVHKLVKRILKGKTAAQGFEPPSPTWDGTPTAGGDDADAAAAAAAAAGGGGVAIIVFVHLKDRVEIRLQSNIVRVWVGEGEISADAFNICWWKETLQRARSQGNENSKEEEEEEEDRVQIFTEGRCI